MTKEQEKLVTDNHNVIYCVLNKLGVDKEDYYDVAAIGMCKAALSYTSDKSKFATYAYTCIRNEVVMEFRKNTACTRVPIDCIEHYDREIESDSCTNSHSTFLDIIPSTQDVENEVIFGIMVLDGYNTLSKVEREVASLLIDGLNQNQIAEKLGVTQPYVSRVMKRIKTKLK